MGRVKGKGPLLTAKFTGKGKKNVPENQASKALMLLSIVGNEFCSGEYLQASAIQAAKEFDFTTFLIAGEVYWHNLKEFGYLLSENGEKELKAHACRLGDDYFKANLDGFLAPFDEDKRNSLKKKLNNKTVGEQIDLINKAAQKRPKKFEIVRWNTWINRPLKDGQNYCKIKGQIEKCYENVKSLEASIAKTALNFASRHKNDGGEELWLMRSMGYLKEESPAVMLLGADREYNFIVYPGDMIAPFQATKDFFIPKSEDVPNDDKLSPHLILVEKSNTLLNWLQPFFNRSQPEEILKNATHPSTTAPLAPESSRTTQVTQLQTQSLVAETSYPKTEVESNTFSIPQIPYQPNPAGFFASRTSAPQEQKEKLKAIAEQSVGLIEEIIKNNSEVSPEASKTAVGGISNLLAALTPDQRNETIALLAKQAQMMNEVTKDLETQPEQIATITATNKTTMYK